MKDILSKNKQNEYVLRHIFHCTNCQYKGLLSCKPLIFLTDYLNNGTIKTELDFQEFNRLQIPKLTLGDKS